MRVMIFVDWYLPGYKAGGQISSCANIVRALRGSCELFVVTRDRDLDDQQTYKGIRTDTWTEDGKQCSIFYVAEGNRSLARFKRLIREVQPDTIYLNSMFSAGYAMLPLLAAKQTGFKGKMVLAPRGMLQQGALRFKPFKKKLAIRLLHATGLLRSVVFHATDETEAKDIAQNIPGNPPIELVYDFPTMSQEPLQSIRKDSGTLHCLFISRVVGKKNLLYLLNRLAHVKGTVVLSVVGPIEDESYWNQCKEAIASLPAQHRVEYVGAVPNPQLAGYYQRHHLFVLPTLGENFGHVIFDAFRAGRPVLISTRTPWRNLEEQKAGTDIDLSDETGWQRALERFIEMDQDTYDQWTSGAWELAAAHISNASYLKQKYLALFS
ncbi:MAG: glycosyltransferase [Bacteroidota bacterium]|nr:glycosyltransferase [Bacteroidota bacterium]